MASNNYAGFWLRFVAYLIDSIILSILQWIIILPILGMFGLSFASGGYDFDSMSDTEIIAMVTAFIAALSSGIILLTILQILYFTIMEASKYQATFGKMALGLIVTDENGKPLDFVKSLVRNLGKIISSAIFMIGYIMAGFTPKKQALHDMIISALVVKK